MTVEHTVFDGGVIRHTAFPEVLAIEVGAGLPAITDAVDGGEIPHASGAIERGMVVDIHHGGETGMELGKTVSAIDGGRFRNEDIGTYLGIVTDIATRDDGVDPVVSSTLEDEDHFLRVAGCGGGIGTPLEGAPEGE